MPTVTSYKWCDDCDKLQMHTLEGGCICSNDMCEDCPPVGYPTEKTRCLECPRQPASMEQKDGS